MSEERERRLTANEAVARDVNEVIDHVTSSWYEDDELLHFRCECTRADCRGHVSLTRREYESVRAEAVRFVVLEGHEDPDHERVAGRIREHLIVEKTGSGTDVARETDPRA